MLDKARLLQQFNAAAWEYQDAAVLQDYTAGQLLDRLQLMNIKPRAILDLGSGTGSNSYRLAGLYPGARIIQMDFAMNMLRQAQGVMSGKKNQFSFLCADADQNPIADSCIDLIHSNLMVQWSTDPVQLYSNILRTLRNGGLFLFSSLGPDTLKELRSSWASVDDGTHVNEFMDIRELGDILVQAGFADPVMEADYVNIAYDKIDDLFKDLKKLGASNASNSRRKTLTGKDRFLDMQVHYEKCRKDGKLPASYEVVFGHAWAIKNKRAETGSDFRISLDSLKNSLSRLKGRHRR